MKSEWKRLLTLTLSAIVFSSQTFAASQPLPAPETLIYQIKDQNTPNAKIAVTLLSEEDQTEFLSQVQTELKTNESSAVLLATTGPADPLRQTDEYKDLSTTRTDQVVLVEADSIDNLPAPTKESRSYKERLKTLLKKKPSKLSSEQKAAIAVSVIPAGNYGTLVYFMSADYVMATASFGTVLAINAFQALFTKQWLQFASLGEKGALKVLQGLAKISGNKFSTRSRNLAGGFGRIGITTGMNTALAAITMTLSGTLDSVWALLYFGYSSSYDLWDQVLENKINNSAFFKKHFINSRLAIGSLVECFALAGNGIAELILLSASASSTAGLLFKAARETDTPKPSLKERIKVKWKKIKSHFENQTADHKSAPCLLYLSAPAFL